jgi:hypothetical protein
MKVVLLFTVMAGILTAALQHPVGLAPILAALLCAACFLRKRDVVIVGLGAMLIHEAMVGFSLFTIVRLVAILGVIGVIWAIRVRPAWPSLLLGLSLSAPVYHLALATGDWVIQFCTKAPHTAAGFAATLMSSLPYIQRSVVNEVFFTAAFLGLYALSGSAIRLWWPAALPQAVSNK